jgi:L-ascorbate metabolism protein UlaG (beta-lactamase superfamily)
MKITYYGHSCFHVEVEGRKLLFDPYITENKLAAHINISSIEADYILISHGHDDHIGDAVKIAEATGATVVSNFEIVEWLGKQGVSKTHSMNIGGHWIFDFGKLKCVNAVHSSSLPDGSYGGSAMGFLVETKDKNFYYSGDTALTYDMKLIGVYKTMDFALLPIGNNFTMGIENALIASSFINCDEIIGLHYDTFPSIKIDHQEATEKFYLAGKTLHLIPIGSSIEL